MSAHLINSDRGPFHSIDLLKCMRQTSHVVQLLEQGFSQYLKMPDLLKRSTDNLYWPTNLGSIYAVFTARFLCLFGGIVAITEDRNVNSRIVFDSSNQGPVSCAFGAFVCGYDRAQWLLVFPISCNLSTQPQLYSLYLSSHPNRVLTVTGSLTALTIASVMLTIFRISWSNAAPAPCTQQL